MSYSIVQQPSCIQGTASREEKMFLKRVLNSFTQFAQDSSEKSDEMVDGGNYMP